MERARAAPIATFFTTGPIAAGGTVSLAEGEAHHARVRRVSLGERVRLVDGCGTIGWGAVVKLSKSYAVVDVHGALTQPPPPAVHLIVPIADRERMLWLAEKVTELGIASWRPVMWRRSKSVSPRGEGVGFQQKVRARMISALTQSGGGWLPTLYPDSPLAWAIAAAPPGARFLLDREGVPLLKQLSGGARSPDGAVEPLILALGPEGGVEPTEREQLMTSGFVPVTLATSSLRFETAGVAALAVARAVLTTSVEATRD